MNFGVFKYTISNFIVPDVYDTLQLGWGSEGHGLEQDWLRGLTNCQNSEFSECQTFEVI